MVVIVMSPNETTRTDAEQCECETTLAVACDHCLRRGVRA